MTKATVTAFELITQSIHTLVGHWRPDLELLFIFWLIRNFKVVRKAMNVRKDAREYYIPSGPLRSRDWGELRGAIRELNAETVEGQGYLFIDCGGGGSRFDQHGRENRDDETSIALVCAYLDTVASIDGPLNADERDELKAVIDVLQAFIQVVSDNDATGLDTAVKDEKAATSSTPHTQRTLRNFVLGLNVLYPLEPRKVSSLVYMAFDGIYDSLRKNPSDEETDMRRLMLCEEFLPAVEGFFGAASGDASRFRFYAEKAYRAYEDEWEIGLRDYNDPDKTVHRTISHPRFWTWLPELHVCLIKSASTRASQVARFAPGDQPKADLILQWTRDGHFMLTTRGKVELPAVLVAELRKADLFARGWRGLLTQEHYEQLAESGRHTIVVKDEKGVDQTVPVLFWTDYRKACGNEFRSNPFAVKTGLTSVAAARIVSEMFTNGPRLPKREFQPDRKEGKGQRQAPRRSDERAPAARQGSQRRDDSNRGRGRDGRRHFSELLK